MPIIISFDGNIGSGKSSVVKYFEKILKNFVILKHIIIKYVFFKNQFPLGNLLLIKMIIKILLKNFMQIIKNMVLRFK